LRLPPTLDHAGREIPADERDEDISIEGPLAGRGDRTRPRNKVGAA
jgi:hypothetical protein